MGVTPRKPTPEEIAKIKAILLTLDDDALTSDAIAKKFEWEPDAATAIVRKIRKSVVKSAEVDQKEALGVARERLNQIYKTAIQTQDAKTALAAQKELNKLQAIYNKIDQREAAKVDREKEETRRILESAVDGDYGRLDDLARVVVYKLLDIKTK